ncbi:YesL family protein [Neobacillus notoginsengisoli]
MFSKYFFLNIIWLIMCLPIITIFPSTSAMFSIIRKWTMKEELANIAGEFFYQFKSNFFKSFITGFIWIFIGFVIYLYFLINLEISSTILFYLLVFLCLGFLLMSVYLIPVLVHYDISIIKVYKFSIIYSISQLQYTLLNCLFISLFGIIIYLQPFFCLFLFSIFAHLIYFICHKSFENVSKKTNKNL